MRVEKKLSVIEQPIPPAHTTDSEAQVLAEWNAVYDAHNEVACLMFRSINPELHRQFENSSHYEMLQEIKSMFEKQAGGYVEQLERLGYVLPQDLSVGLIMNGPTSDFVGFVRNYNMHNMGKTIGELHALLIEYEKALPKKVVTPQVMAIQGSRIQKANKKSLNAKGKGKGKGKGKDKSYIPELKNPKPSAKEHPAKDDTCHHCKEVGHWKRNCLVFLAELVMKKKKVGTASSLGIFIIELFSFPNKSYVYDTGCDTHFCNTKQGLRGVRKLKQGSYSNKRVKHKLDSTYLWHCRLAHISKKRIKKLQHDGLLKSTDEESFDKCVSCLSGKMTRKPFPHRTERVTGLLGLIHIDVCGPLRHVSRQGASYFITFTDDYSKHEVFETFKVFKNEVKNQLRKTIKALRSNRGGEYISQKFKDYLKACGIVQRLTPPYAPQHNDVSKKRNRTFLDMVRSMMNLTTLPLSFWDYALESATRILNMVPTKKVYKTPYELWYGKVPNLYPKETMGYYFYFLPENKIVLARYAEFLEKNLISQEVNGRAIELEEFKMKIHHLLKTIAKFLRRLKCLVDIPPNGKTVGSKWLFMKKTDMDGIVRTYKAHLVAKGFTQTYGVDYEERFSPVADIRAIRILIAIIAFYDYEIWKMDVKTAFLNGYLDEDIYMVQLEASRSWNKRFDEEIKKFGFAQNLDELCVYQKASGSNVTFLILYVGDIIIMGNHIPSLQSVKSYLGKCFVMIDLGEVAFILGIKIYRDRSK
ncbi:retrotransposon protein, putative, ty1-copia subclass [Tanacetum coccineum]|uniref:Retrotransposon protein, putative, ty1-copia subclass n=1 Tax=Tanacetum coccineum TaxID=301880 RepID=A0ABQ4Z4I1_9ASTR